MSGQGLSRLAALVLVLATVICLALVTCIALLFTIGKPTTMTSTGSGKENSTAAFTLAQPCDCGCPTISPLTSSRITQGETAIQGSWPWQMLLIVYDRNNEPSSYCGGTLITPKHVLTAAHCVAGYAPQKIGIVPGAHYTNSLNWPQSTAYLAEKIYTHESYNNRVFTADVAVIRLRTPIPLDERVSLACLASSNLDGQPLNEYDPLIATGWGYTVYLNSTIPDELQQVRLQYVSDEHPLCIGVDNIPVNERPGQMCVGFKPRGACTGDSGGPAVRLLRHANGKAYYQQVGIASATVSNCGHSSNFSDIYTRVNYYHEWIVDKVRLSL